MAKKKTAATPLGRDALLAKKPLEIRSFELPSGDLVNYVVHRFVDVKDVLAQFEGAEEYAQRLAVVTLLITRSLCDPEGNPILEDEDVDALFEAMDMKNYMALNKHIQVEYGLLRDDAKESENLKGTPGE